MSGAVPSPMRASSRRSSSASSSASDALHHSQSAAAASTGGGSWKSTGTARMTSVEILNQGVPPHMRRPPTDGWSSAAAAATATAGSHSPATAAVPPGASTARDQPPSFRAADSGGEFDPWNEAFNEMEILHAAKAAALLAATLAAAREADWSVNRTSELPSAMLSEARVLGAPGGPAAPDRYHRAARWPLSPASLLHHLPVDSRRQEVSQLRELVRQRRRERDEAEAIRFEERLREKQRRRAAKEDSKRRAEYSAADEDRRREREKRKQRKGGRPSGTRETSMSASSFNNNSFNNNSFRAGGGDMATLLALLQPAAGANGAAQAGGMSVDPEASLEVDHSALVIAQPGDMEQDQQFPLADAATAAASDFAVSLASPPADAPGCTGIDCVPHACKYFRLDSYAPPCVPLHPFGLTGVSLSLRGRNHSSRTLCVHLSSTAPQHVFFRGAAAPSEEDPSSSLSLSAGGPVSFVYAHAPHEIALDFVGDFRAHCAALQADANTGAVPAASQSPPELIVSVRVLSRADIAAGFASVHPALYWQHAEEQANKEREGKAAHAAMEAPAASPAAGAMHSFRVPLRWTVGDGSDNNIPGMDEARFELLKRQQARLEQRLRSSGSGNNRQSSSLDPSSAAGTVAPRGVLGLVVSPDLPVEQPSSLFGSAAAPVRRKRSSRSRTMLSLRSMRTAVDSAFKRSDTSLSPTSASAKSPNHADAVSAQERRRSRRRSRAVRPVMPSASAAGAKEGGSCGSLEPSVPVVAEDVPAAEGGDEDAADAVDPIHAERMARRRTMKQVDARRQRTGPAVDGGDGAGGALEEEGEDGPALLEANAGAQLLRRAEEAIRQQHDEEQRQRSLPRPAVIADPSASTAIPSPTAVTGAVAVATLSASPTVRVDVSPSREGGADVFVEAQSDAVPTVAATQAAEEEEGESSQAADSTVRDRSAAASPPQSQSSAAAQTTLTWLDEASPAPSPLSNQTTRSPQAQSQAHARRPSQSAVRPAARATVAVPSRPRPPLEIAAEEASYFAAAVDSDDDDAAGADEPAAASASRHPEALRTPSQAGAKASAKHQPDEKQPEPHDDDGEAATVAAIGELGDSSSSVVSPSGRLRSPPQLSAAPVPLFASSARRALASSAYLSSLSPSRRARPNEAGVAAARSVYGGGMDSAIMTLQKQRPHPRPSQSPSRAAKLAAASPLSSPTAPLASSLPLRASASQPALRAAQRSPAATGLAANPYQRGLTTAADRTLKPKPATPQPFHPLHAAVAATAAHSPSPSASPLLRGGWD